MTNKPALKLAAEFLKNKLAAAEDKQAPEAPEAPEAVVPPAAEAPELPAEALQENIGVADAAPLADPSVSPEGAPQGDEIDQLLSQLSPEELEQLATELAGDIQGGGAEEDGQVGALAQAIAAHLGEQPEAAMKSAELDFVKSAEYIEGFLARAVEHGASIKQAVDLYDQALSHTSNLLKSSALKGDQHKLDVDNDGKIEAEDLKKLREGKKKEEHVDEKTAAYYEGVIERAREYGIADADTLAFVKSAMVSTKSVGEALRSGYNKSKAFMSGAMKGNKADMVSGEGADAFYKGKQTASFARRNKKALGAGAAAAAATGVIASGVKREKKQQEDRLSNLAESANQEENK
jgi:hypothetical protein